jgi:hypothetical protein
VTGTPPSRAGIALLLHRRLPILRAKPAAPRAWLSG